MSHPGLSQRQLLPGPGLSHNVNIIVQIVEVRLGGLFDSDCVVRSSVLIGGVPFLPLALSSLEGHPIPTEGHQRHRV